MTSYSCGDVVLVEWPHTDFADYGKRPALVVQSEKLATGFADQVIAQITTSERLGPSRLLVKKASSAGRQMGLLYDSYVVCDKLQTLHPRRIIKKIGTCPLMNEVRRALAAVFGMDSPP